MSYIDLQATLAEWPYDAEQISVRKILGSDGMIRVQMRVELGVLQMESEERPDGEHPHGCESYLEYFRKKLDRYEHQHGTTEGFMLSPQECHNLRIEASLYYRRYVALFVLEEFKDVVEDASHNLEIFDLCREYAEDANDRACLESFKPYVLMMNARARALDAEQHHEMASAIAHVNRGIMHLQTHYQEQGSPELLESCEEMKMLRSLAGELRDKLPQDTLSTAKRALRTAVEREQFEEAARLRDVLKDLNEQPK